MFLLFAFLFTLPYLFLFLVCFVMYASYSVCTIVLMFSSADFSTLFRFVVVVVIIVLVTVIIVVIVILAVVVVVLVFFCFFVSVMLTVLLGFVSIFELFCRPTGGDL